jgi:predicted nucleic-acid-binding Zn-ribbon protein
MSELSIQPQLNPCSECGGERVQAECGTGMYILNSQKKKLFNLSSNVLTAIVCIHCGYTTLYTRNPSQLKG